MLIRLDSPRCESLTDQIVTGIERLVDNRTLRPESQLPSIRKFAAAHDVSKFTVVQAYDRLGASGYIQSREGAGFFVCKPARSTEPVEAGLPPDQATDVLWLMRHQANSYRFKHLPGCGWLPPQWMEESGLDRAMRDLSRRGVNGFLSGYGDPLGFLPLREYLCRWLAEHGIDASTNQILLTNGITGGIDLVARHLIQPDDVVLVDDPGHFQRFGHMRALGANVQGVPRTSTGPDLEKLESLVTTYHPRLFITAPIVHNPTGLSISQGTAFRLLKLAEHYDFHIVEDDTHGVVHPAPPPRLAGLDQLNRVVYVNSFSFGLSARLRVGALVGSRDLVQDLADLKLLTQASSSEHNERLVHEVLAQGRYRKYRSKLLARLQRARSMGLRRLESIGLGPDTDNTHGIFAWLDVPGVADSTPLAEAAVERGMLLAPGAMFRPNMAPSTKMRFNVAYCEDDEVLRELEALLSTEAFA